MADDYYIPGMPTNLQGLLYTPNQGPAATKQLRAEHAGNPRMQQQLAVDDRYHQGKGMTEASPLAALGALAGSVPYDAAKLAYFHGPQSVKQGLGKLTERLFPGEGFNDKTTARPSIDQYKGYVHGMAEAGYGKVRDTVKDWNGVRFSDETTDRLASFAKWAGNRDMAGSLFEDKVMGPKAIDLSSQEAARSSMKKWGMRQAVAHGLDPVGTSLKALSNVVQTLVPDADSRQQFDDWMPNKGLHMQAIAPGMKPIKRMSPERKREHEAEISRILESWK